MLIYDNLKANLKGCFRTFIKNSKLLFAEILIQLKSQTCCVLIFCADDFDEIIKSIDISLFSNVKKFNHFIMKSRFQLILITLRRDSSIRTGAYRLNEIVVFVLRGWWIAVGQNRSLLYLSRWELIVSRCTRETTSRLNFRSPA